MRRVAKAIGAAIYVAGGISMGWAAAGDPYDGEHPASYWLGVTVSAVTWPVIAAAGAIAAINDVYHDTRRNA